MPDKSYVRHPKFATAPKQYIRAFNVLQKDLFEIFDYIEPCDRNLSTHSYRTHALLTRTCIEVEANFKAILEENGYVPPKRRQFNITDYEKVNATHHLSSYKVQIPDWHGGDNVREPYSGWRTSPGSLPWYQAYNASKHNRLRAFEEANFKHLTNAICGLVVLLSAQFGKDDFASVHGLGYYAYEFRDKFEVGLGDYFRVQFPDDWPEAERYDFDWRVLQNQPDPFDNLTF